MAGDRGRLLKIWIKRSKGGPMDEVTEAVLVKDRGLEGNANQGGWRQVTMIAVEPWEAACRQLARSVEPSARRANLLLEAVDLREARDRELQIGEARLLLRGETRPCERMEQAASGLRDALSPEWRAGAFAQVIKGGTIRTGDLVRYVGDDVSDPR